MLGLAIKTLEVIINCMAHKKAGVITKEIGAIIEPHEAVAADALALAGLSVHFIAPRNTYMTKTPDIFMSGAEWEIKSPTGGDKTTVRNILNKAKKQSRNIVLDTMRTNMQDDQIIVHLTTYLRVHPSIKKMLVIKKTREIVVLKGKL